MLRRIRLFLARYIERFLVGSKPITIISEDCWGGEFCRSLGWAYTTPLAGVWIVSSDYVSFLENLRQPDAFQLEPVEGSEAYPVGRTPYATLHFPHFHDWEEARDKFQRRAGRIVWDRVFYKIDFGKPDYTQRDVDKWTSLRLPGSIALVPVTARSLDYSKVHQGVALPEWHLDGGMMFYVARRYFDFYHWIRTGKIRQSWFTRMLNVLFCDPFYPRDLKKKLRKMMVKDRSGGR